MDNKYNATTLEACEIAKTQRVQLVSLKEKGIENYEKVLARDQDAVPSPKWPTQGLGELINTAFTGCQIDREDHPALLRLILARQSLS